MNKVELTHNLLGKRKNNIEHDFYSTPDWATTELLKRESFIGDIVEPASGNGAISRVLEAEGYKVISSDIRNDDIYGNGGIDFLQLDICADNYITNPPFKLAQKFLNKMQSTCSGKICLLLRLAFLESKGRYEMFKSHIYPLKSVYVFSERLSFDETQKGMVCFAWFVWDKNYKGKPVIDWIKR